MTKREFLAISAAALLAVLGAAAILLGGLREAAAQRLRDRPWNGTLAAFQQEHIAALNEAAEILWENPAFFEQCRGGPNSSDSLIDRWSIRWGRIGQAPLTDEQWQAVLRLYEPQRCVNITYYWWPGPLLVFCVRTTEDGSDDLIYIPAEARAAEDALRMLEAIPWLGRCEGTAYPGWYAAYREEST